MSEDRLVGEVVLPCDELEPTLACFTDELGFRIEMVRPADDPVIAVVVGHGVRIRLERGYDGAPGLLRLVGGESTEPRTVIAPNGTCIELVAEGLVADGLDGLVLPDLSPMLEITRPDGTDAGTGRAGMGYRDLLPTRQGGRFIASHITIPDGGPVPDYVHHHRIRFQVIYCARGWVRVAYEDQGPPFVLEAGDCVLQPPGIRHRVLDSSPGLEVIEVTCPADHATYADHTMALPTSDHDPDRSFGGQRFVRHRGAGATWSPWRAPGFEARDTGIVTATGGLADVHIVRATAAGGPMPMTSHQTELRFWYVLDGSATLRLAGRADEELAAGTAVAVPAGLDHALAEWSSDVELLEVTVS